MVSNLCGTIFINVGLLLRTLSQLNFLLLLPSRSTSRLPHLFIYSVLWHYLSRVKIWSYCESNVKCNIYLFLEFWSQQKKEVSNYKTLLFSFASTSSFFVASLFCCSVFSTFSSPLFQFDSVWINCSSYGRRHTISLNPDNGVWLGRGEYTANLLTAHLPNDWCLHATSPEECLSQRHFLHLNNAHTLPRQMSSKTHTSSRASALIQYQAGNTWSTDCAFSALTAGLGRTFSNFLNFFFMITHIPPFFKQFHIPPPACSPQPFLLPSYLLPNTVLPLCCPINHPSLINRPTVPSLPTAPTPHLAQPCCPAGMQSTPTLRRIYAHSTNWSAAGNWPPSNWSAVSKIGI